MTTVEWFRIDFARQLRRQLPGLLRPVFPYRLVTGLFLGGGEGYVSLIEHEAFHAFQGELAPDQLAAAERAARRRAGPIRRGAGVPGRLARGAGAARGRRARRRRAAER